jgi:hypothetical protein
LQLEILPNKDPHTEVQRSWNQNTGYTNTMLKESHYHTVVYQCILSHCNTLNNNNTAVQDWFQIVIKININEVDKMTAIIVNENYSVLQKNNTICTFQRHDIYSNVAEMGKGEYRKP